jgi:protein-disulfide isomerase
LRITRREFLEGAAALALVGGVTLSAMSSNDFAFVGGAYAQEKPMSDLLVAGPLGDRILGSETAPVLMIEYASLTCPHCAHFENTTFPELKKRYIDTGKVRYIFREFVLNHLDAAAAMLAHCIDADKYYPFIETLYQKQDEWVVQKPKEPLFNIAKQAGFTEKSFEECLANQKVLDGIEWVRSRAAKDFGVQSTPTFFINGKMHTGDLKMEELEKIMAPYLKGT